MYLDVVFFKLGKGQTVVEPQQSMVLVSVSHNNNIAMYFCMEVLKSGVCEEFLWTGKPPPLCPLCFFRPCLASAPRVCTKYCSMHQQALQGCNLELLICWSVVEGLKPKCKMKISVQKLADWLMNFKLNINQKLTFSQSSFFQPNPKTRVGVCVKEEDRGYKAADCE